MNSIIFILVDNKFYERWIKCIANMNLAADILDRKFNQQHFDKAAQAYLERRAAITELEYNYIAPILLIRNQYIWNIYISQKIIVMTMPNSLYKDEIEYLKNRKVSFISNTNEHSEDEFGNNENIKNLMKRYIETEPNKIGFN